MALIKQIKVFNGSTWNTGDIGANASNVSLSTSAISSVITNVESGVKYLNDNKVSKSGDTMTGNLTINASLITTGTVTGNNNFWIKSTNTTVDGISNANSNLYTPSLVFSGPEIDSNQMGYIQGFMYSTSIDERGNGLRITGRRKVSDSWVDNNLWLGVNSTGKRTVVVTDADAWRTGLDIFRKTVINTSGSANLNNYTIEGYYYFSSNVTLSNVPNSAVNGWLLVLPTDGNYVKQIWMRLGSTSGSPPTYTQIYERVGNGTTWYDWERVTTQSLLPQNHASTATTYGIGAPSTYGHTKVINNLTTSTSANGQALNAYQGYLLSTKINALNHSFSGKTLDGTSIATTTNKALGNIALAAGSYIIFGKAKFASNATGRRAFGISTVANDDADSGINRMLVVNAAPVTGAPTELSVTGVATLSSASTIYLNVYQNSGSSLTISGGLYAYKLGI